MGVGFGLWGRELNENTSWWSFRTLFSISCSNQFLKCKMFFIRMTEMKKEQDKSGARYIVWTLRPRRFLPKSRFKTVSVIKHPGFPQIALLVTSENSSKVLVALYDMITIAHGGQYINSFQPLLPGYLPKNTTIYTKWY